MSRRVSGADPDDACPDAAAGKRLVQRHYRRILLFFYSKVGPELGRDLTQDTFETLCARRVAFRGEANVLTYLFGIARWKLVHHLRHDRGCYGLQSPILTGATMPATLDELADVYADLIADEFGEDEFHLVGWSAGGVIAFELARRAAAKGLGLQKLASNYVSGFVILAERSMRIGDVVKIDDFEGRITDIKTRYTLIRAANGRESIVPNEKLITERIENLSLADSRVLLSTDVAVGYDSDVDEVVRILEQCALVSPRVLKDPAPGARLAKFGADGLEFQLLFWIEDPENGQLNVRSDINMAILKALRAAGIGRGDRRRPPPGRPIHPRRPRPGTRRPGRTS